MTTFAIPILLALIAVLLLVVIYLLLRMRAMVIAIHDSLGTTDRIITKSNDFTPVVHGKVFVIVGGILGLVIVVAGLAVVTFKTKDGILVVEVNEPDSQVQLLNADRQIEISRKVEKGPITIAINPGRHQLNVQKNGFEFYTGDFDIKSGEKTSMIAKLVPVKVEAATQNADRAE